MVLSRQDLKSCRQEDGGAVFDPGVWTDCCGWVSFPGPVTVTGGWWSEAGVELGRGLDEGQVRDSRGTCERRRWGG